VPDAATPEQSMMLGDWLYSVDGKEQAYMIDFTWGAESVPQA
jgi:hypothetical protein